LLAAAKKGFGLQNSRWSCSAHLSCKARDVTSEHWLIMQATTLCWCKRCKTFVVIFHSPEGVEPSLYSWSRICWYCYVQSKPRTS